MKKPVKILLIGLGSVIGLIIILALAYMIYFKINTSNMTSIDTKEVNEKIFSVKDDFVNMFLIRTNDKYIAIDAGNDISIIENQMKKLNIDPDKVAVVLLTHADADHTAALTLFKNATVYLSNEEEQMINGKTSRFFLYNNKIDTEYKLLNHNQEMDISGVKVRCILTPGHTPGSMCYLINGMYLFTGDTMSLKNGKVEIFTDAFNMDTETERKSLTMLSGMTGPEYIFTAHHGFTDNFAEAFSSWQK